MALDVGVLSSYLTMWLYRGARQLADRTFEVLLDRLANLIEQRIGQRTLRALRKNPGDIEIATQVSHKIATVAQRDHAFASELQKLIRDLDRCGGRTVINQVNQVTGQNVQAFGGQARAAGRDQFNVNVPDPDDWSRAPSWVKATFVLGAVIFALGLAINLLTMNRVPQGFPLGWGVFVIGFVILLVGALGKMMSGRK
jgi:hypothetical protein